jgi:hypothetical protein
MDDYCNKMENNFILTYHEFLYFKHSFISSMPIKLCREKGIRVDRVLECEVLTNLNS